MSVYALPRTFDTLHAYGAAHPPKRVNSAWPRPFPRRVRFVRTARHGLVRHFNLSVSPGLGKAHDVVDEGVGPRFFEGKLHETALRGKHGEGLGSPSPTANGIASVNERISTLVPDGIELPTDDVELHGSIRA